MRYIRGRFPNFNSIIDGDPIGEMSSVLLGHSLFVVSQLLQGPRRRTHRYHLCWGSRAAQ